MSDPVSGIPGQRGPVEDAIPGVDSASIPLAELMAWHEPGVHRVRLADRDVWVRMDGRGIASVSSVGPDRLADRPVE